jgi:D-alanyl-D-alanine carboxypeptidase (penicillin-binding protein 5/6)
LNKKSLVVAISLIIVILFCHPGLASEGPYVSADAAILMDADSGQVLYTKNPFKTRPPASTTKVITALLAMESGQLNDLVTVSRAAASTAGSSMYLRVGETVSLSDLLYGALLNSGNDACVAIAEHIAGSRESFAALMNIKALSLGAVNTNFTNPHGLPDKEHYTCAYDLALIARAALNNKKFSEIVVTKNKVIEIPGQNQGHRLQNTNQLLWKYLWADGIKTGTTSAAGPCLVSSASKGNRKLIAVVLSSGDRWADSMKLFEYGFNSFSYYQVAVTGAVYGSIPVQNSEKESLAVVYANDLGVLVPSIGDRGIKKRAIIMTDLLAPIKKGQVIGMVSYYVSQNFVRSTDLIANEDLEIQSFWGLFKRWLQGGISIVFSNL